MVRTPIEIAAAFRSSDGWVPMFTLPGVCIQEPIEVDGLAFVSSHDARIIDLAEKHRRFRMYLKRFTTEFGDPITPRFVTLSLSRAFPAVGRWL